MINEILHMNGYGIYVFSAFIFTLSSFATLYFVTKTQFVKEQNKFVAKFGSLNTDKALISEGDWKYTTFSSSDFKTRNTVKIKVIKISATNKNLNLTLRPYMV